MEFQEFVRERDRMCDGYGNCEECPIHKLSVIGTCAKKCFEKPAEVERIVSDWSKEHPLVTNKDKFMKVFGFDLCAMDCDENTMIWLNTEYKEPGGKQND